MSAPIIHYTNNLKMFFPKVCGYGASGAGKSTLIGTAPRPFVISTESGLLPLRKMKIAYCTVNTEKELKDVSAWLRDSREPRANYDTICTDSVSDIAETVLSDKKRTKKDIRAAYGEMQDLMSTFVRDMRDLQGLCLYMIAKETVGKNSFGGSISMPNMPDKRSMEDLPYKFDAVLHVQAISQPDGTVLHALKTRTDERSLAKDRSGNLDMWEQPNLMHIFKKLVQ